ncbi:zinc finger MYM-type protein 1-like [Gordionus sp. m RMFG-2023]|uniref:zinc finger MYM-type protein 1-like n=1 Tax=Gordionus sp. m RMFG-2023 TaxID=3053472 RepID=UPI0031FBAFBF
MHKHENFKLQLTATIPQKLAFLMQHPIQPINSEYDKLYYLMIMNEKIPRKWITIELMCNKAKAVYCSICLAFAVCENTFTTGSTNFRHMHSVIKIHETKVHISAVEAYLRSSKNKSFDNSISIKILNEKNRQIYSNVHIIKQIFEIIKFLGKQNLPYRGSNVTETLSHFVNENLNHGNFLEMIRIISKNDQILRDHLEKAILKSKRRKKKLKLSEKSKGRGSLITLLSKTTVNKVIDVVLDQIRNLIKKEIGNKRFSLQMDSTQDISVYDQATICLRYIYNGKITERLFALTKVTNSSGKGFFDILSECFLKHGIQMRNIIGELFNGAANMRGELVGLLALIRQQQGFEPNPNPEK